MDTFAKAGFDYLNGGVVTHQTESSTLVSSSPYLNHGPLREMIAQEMLRRNGSDLPNTAYVADIMQMFAKFDDIPQLVALFDSEVERLPELKARVERRGSSNFTAEDTAGFAPGTLGNTIHDFIVNSGYQLDFFHQGMDTSSNFGFFSKEKQLSHDILHMVTGFPTNNGGERALSAAEIRANFAYYKPEFAVWLNRAWLYLKARSTMRSMLFYPESSAAELMVEDFGARQAAEWKFPLNLITWRDHLDWQIADIREEYGVRTIPEAGVWDWTTAVSEDARAAKSPSDLLAAE